MGISAVTTRGFQKPRIENAPKVSLSMPWLCPACSIPAGSLATCSLLSAQSMTLCQCLAVLSVAPHCGSDGFLHQQERRVLGMPQVCPVCAAGHSCAGTCNRGRYNQHSSFPNSSWGTSLSLAVTGLCCCAVTPSQHS